MDTMHKVLVALGASLLFIPSILPVTHVAAEDNADDPKVGDPAIPKVGPSQYIGSATKDGTVSGNGEAGVTIIPGTLALNRVPDFDFGTHGVNISGATYDLVKMVKNDGNPADKDDYNPSLDPPATNTTPVRAGTRSLVVTDGRIDNDTVTKTGYSVSLGVGEFHLVKPSKQGNTDVYVDTGNTVSGASLIFESPVVHTESSTLRDFLLKKRPQREDESDADYAKVLPLVTGHPAVYPGLYSESDPGTLTTTNNRMQAVDAPWGNSVTVTNGTSQATVLYTAENKYDNRNARATGTWIYDYSQPGSVKLRIAGLDNGGLWVAKLTWVLSTDPVASGDALTNYTLPADSNDVPDNVRDMDGNQTPIVQD